MKVLFGAGMVGRIAVQVYGVGSIRCIIDSNRKESLYNIPVVSLKEYKSEYYNSEDEIVITVFGDKQYEIAQMLRGENLSFSFYHDYENVEGLKGNVRLGGIYPDVRVCIDRKQLTESNVEHRAFLSTEMIRYVLSKYKEEFVGKSLDITLSTSDVPELAFEYMSEKQLNNILAYSTVYSYEDIVVPIPDYRCFFDKDIYYFHENMEESIKARSTKIGDNRIHWRGSTFTSEGRCWLKRLSEKYPDIIDFEEYDGKTYYPMTDFTDHKYSLDIRGYGFTDRVANLMWLMRPIFLVDRPYKQWFYQYMEPMKHYIPVREDLSDLEEKYRYLEGNDDLYHDIQNNMESFCNEYLSPKGVCEYMKGIIDQYGVVKD